MSFPYKKFSNILKAGAGESDEIFIATVRATSHKVVIKKLASDLKEYKGNFKMFDKNVKTLKSLHHDNIIRVFDYGAYENSYYMSMDFIDGFDLEQLIQNPLFDRTIGLMIVFQALKGLAYAHKHGVSHCDIKPGNILVMKNGRAKLSDFGLAHVKEHFLHIGNSGAVFTTPFYMPPEQASAIAEQALDSDVWAETTTLAYKETLEDHTESVHNQTVYWDIWSVGVLLYRMVTGRFPFNGDNLAQLANSIATLQPGDLNKLAPSLPADLAYVINCCLIKDPKKRIASLDPVIAALQLYLLSTGVQDFETAIKKHFHDSIPPREDSDVPLLSPENDTGIPPKAKLQLPQFARSRVFAITGIAVTVVVILALCTMFFSTRSAMHPKGPVPTDQVRTIAPVNHSVAADLKPPVAPAETSATPAVAEIAKTDSANPDTTVSELVAEPDQKVIPEKATSRKKKPPVALKAASSMTQDQHSAIPLNNVTEHNTGILKANVDPSDADFSIDGERVSSQEIADGKPLPTGAHTIVASKTGYTPVQQSIQIEENATSNMSIALNKKEPGNGFLHVYSFPWSNIFLDGTMIGTTPTPSPVSLSEGDHVLRLERDGFLPHTETVTIKNGEVARVQIDLIKQTDSTVEK
jgi:serine/threonine protein kinase